jgi:hypothetical protein
MKGTQVGELTDYSSTDVGRRDAFHVPGMLCMVINGDVNPGDKVRFVDDGLVELAGDGESHGVVDPFIKMRGIGGRRLFWVFIDPAYVDNLSHQFDINIDAVTKSATSSDDGYDECAGCYN